MSEFHTSLAEYKEEAVWYGRFSANMLRNSLLAFSSGDREIAGDILRRKEYVSNQYVHLNDRGILLIALHQPVAADLRLISGTLDVITSSERIGRYGKDVAELTAPRGAEIPASLARMGNLTLAFLDLIYNVFESGDGALLCEGAKLEEEIDGLYAGVSDEVIMKMEAGELPVAFGSHCLLVSRYLERCGDHACRMGEKIYYMQTGKRVPFDKIESW